MYVNLCRVNTLTTRNTFCQTRSLSNATFLFLIKSDDFSLSQIYQFSKWRPSAILELFYHHTRPPTKSLLLAAAACQISCQSDTHIWRYSYLNFSRIWLEIPIQAPTMGGFGDFGPLNVIIHHQDPQKAHSCVNLLLKLSTVKIRWPVGELTESVTDTQTDRQTDTQTDR